MRIVLLIDLPLDHKKIIFRTDAHEHAFDHHFTNGKPLLGTMMIHQAIKERLPVDQFATKGPVKLRDAKWENGWLGAFDPIWDSWREIAPVAEFKGDKKRSTWLYNAGVCSCLAWLTLIRTL